MESVVKQGASYKSVISMPDSEGKKHSLVCRPSLSGV